MPRTFFAPGRVNLIGEHTDYSGGLVLPIAIELGVRVSVSAASDVRLEAPGDVGAFADSVAAELDALGRPPVGIHGTVSSTLPIGAGLGSSAALEVAIGIALCAVADFELEPLDLAAACSRAELRATGVPCGILDQAASILGRAGNASLLDCGTLAYRYIPIPEALAVLVIDSGERHELANSAYAQRVHELGEATPLGERRRRHVATENERVRRVVDALEAEDLNRLAALFAESQASLRDDYDVSTPAIDRLVELVLAAGATAARLTGAGFGGSIVVLAERERADDVLRATIERAEGTVGRVVHASDGARELR